MAKQQNTYAKRKREQDKKQKAEEKRARRKRRGENKDLSSQPIDAPGDPLDEHEPPAQ